MFVGCLGMTQQGAGGVGKLWDDTTRGKGQIEKANQFVSFGMWSHGHSARGGFGMT